MISLPPLKRETLFKIVQTVLPRITKITFEGTENIPANGGIILATNHMSRFDIPLLWLNPVRPDITALVADKYQNYAFFRWFALSAGGIWIDRSKADFTAFREAAEVLRQGRTLGIAPEGTRSETHGLLEGKSGTALLAIRCQVPVVPAAIDGSDLTVSELKRFHRPPLTVRFGKPLVFPPLPREDRETALQRCTDEIMCQIAALLPQKYHGFYSGHPRLRELLPGQMA